MRVLVLTTTFPRWQDDVRPAFVYDLSRRLVESGSEVVVLAPHCPGAKRYEIMDGMKVYRFPYFLPERYQVLAYGGGLVPNLIRSALARAQLPLLVAAELFAALYIAKKEGIQIIHAHWLLPQGLVGVIVGKICRIPRITIVHGADVGITRRSKLLNALAYYVISNSDRVVANSNYILSAVLSINEKKTDRVEVIPMGVDANRFAVERNPLLLKRYGAEQLIFSIGRLIDWKGMEYLIMAMPTVVKQYPSARLVIGGTGPEGKKLSALARQLNLEQTVFLVGGIPPQELPSYFASADVFVLPSVQLDGQTEALGVVLIEAMAAGIPVVASNVGGIPDIVQDGYNGFLTSDKSPAELSDRIIRLLEDSETANRFRMNGRRTVAQRFQWEQIASKFAAMNDQLLEQRVV
jgi:glycosyltransferase involved in cell wall biosynthesis